MKGTELKNYKPLAKLVDEIGLVGLDVGARKNINQDLLPLASGVEMYGFEPEPDECARLNNQNSGPWKKLSFIPIALGNEEGYFDLNLYRQRGCSSKLRALQDVGALFSRGDYYIHDGEAKVPAKRLDDVISEYKMEPPAFMKIDVQGMEKKVFQGADCSLGNSLVGIRTEVSFFPLYENQPLFADIDQTLRPYGFVPMRWLELHEWRRTTKLKLPKLGPDPMPYSQGQMIHGDVLYLLHPEMLPSDNETQIKRLVRLGLIAVCYDQLDHALAVFERPVIRDYSMSLTGTDPVSQLHILSQSKSHPYRGFYGMLRKLYQRFL